MANDHLREELCRLVKALQAHDLKLIIGGGYGLILRTEHIRKLGQETRFKEIPIARSTNDFDFFLSVEIISKADKFGNVRDVLREAGYEHLESAKFYHFILPTQFDELPRQIKVDLLGYPAPEIKGKGVIFEQKRIKNKSVKGIHAYKTPEAFTVEENLLTVNIGSDDEPLELFIPHPFSYLLIKLFALRDRLEDEAKEFGAYHAFDIYRTIAMMTEAEWKQACAMREKYANEPKMQEARQIVGELFSSNEAKGVLRVRQHAKIEEFEIPDEDIPGMVKDLCELFPHQ